MEINFDKDAVYDERISPLMKQIIDICKEEGIPMLAQFFIRSADADPDGEDLYCTTTLPAEGITPDDMRRRMHIVRNGEGSSAFAMTITSKNTA